jgi:hypothetical protein
MKTHYLQQIADTSYPSVQVCIDIEFLLPCSPSYDTIMSDGIQIFSFSYVKSFLKNGRKELTLEGGSERSKI